MNHKIILVEWVDSGSSDRWSSLDEIELKKRNLCISCGFLIKEDNEWLVLALSYDPDSGDYQCWLEIPKVAIKKKRHINGPRRGR